jgi:hypothetical protein
MSVSIGVSSLVVAVVVSLAAVGLSASSDRTAVTGPEENFQEVSSDSGQAPIEAREMLDPDTNDQMPAESPAPPEAPTVVQTMQFDVPDRYIINKLGRVNNVNITFYDCRGQGFCGNMYGGRKVYEGAAACSWDLALGTKFYIPGDPTRRVYVCEDRGRLRDTWVDVFWNSPRDGWWWASKVGRMGSIEIVHVP